MPVSFRGYKLVRRNWLILLLVLPGLVTALVLAGHRYSLESRNKAVELTLDYGELLNLSVSSGSPMPALLERFKSVGVTSVAVSERLLAELASTGQIAYRELASERGPLTEIEIRDTRLAGRVFDALKARLGAGMVASSASVKGAPGARQFSSIVVQAAPATLNLIGIGLPPDAVSTVNSSGLQVVARLQNNPAMTEGAVAEAISEVRRQGVAKLIFAGEEVLGFRGLVETTAGHIKSSGLVYGSVEFARQRGDAGMCRYLGGHFVRVHSIPLAEMAGMAPGTAIERFARAVKERNIRVCYIRLFELTGDDPVKTNAAFISAIRGQIAREGYAVGIARPFDDTKQPLALLIPVALSIAAGSVLLLSSLVAVSAAVQIVLLAASFAALAGMIVAGAEQFAALTAAVVFPTLGIARVFGPYLGREIKGSYWHPAIRATSRFARASIYSLIGGVLIAGMLGTRSYMLKTDQFVGIKAAHALPLLAVVFIMAAGLPIMHEPLSAVWRRIRANLGELVGSPLFIWQALAVAFAIGIIGFALIRTGNDPGVGVSGLELKFRAILDKVLLVRPRTKEFLIGHPALILGAAFLFARRRTIGLPLLALGVLGQVSMLNTFCHIHTPLALTVFRAFNGLWFGTIIGLAAWWFVGRPIVRATAVSAQKAGEK